MSYTINVGDLRIAAWIGARVTLVGSVSPYRFFPAVIYTALNTYPPIHLPNDQPLSQVQTDRCQLRRGTYYINLL